MNKKRFIELAQLRAFMAEQSTEVRLEYDTIVNMLEHDGRLTMPFGEKITGRNLFAIRVMQAGNVRVFYAYGVDDYVFGLHGYVKKTKTIPLKEMKQAERMLKFLRAGGKKR